MEFTVGDNGKFNYQALGKKLFKNKKQVIPIGTE